MGWENMVSAGCLLERIAAYHIVTPYVVEFAPVSDLSILLYHMQINLKTLKFARFFSHTPNRARGARITCDCFRKLCVILSYSRANPLSMRASHRSMNFENAAPAPPGAADGFSGFRDHGRQFFSA